MIWLVIGIAVAAGLFRSLHRMIYGDQCPHPQPDLDQGAYDALRRQLRERLIDDCPLDTPEGEP